MQSTNEVIRQFEDAFQTKDASGLASIIAQDCRLVNTSPAPDGAVYEGHDACLKFWSSVATDPNIEFEEEKIEVLGDRALIFWRLKWGKAKNQSVRGVNIMRVKDGKIVEGLGYVKG